ncbi:hypothetical protein ACLKA7_015489 [Drosophila subpalustris]
MYVIWFRLVYDDIVGASVKPQHVLLQRWPGYSSVERQESWGEIVAKQQKKQMLWLLVFVLALLPLAELFSKNYIFSQYVNLNQRKEFIANFHKDYLDSDLTKLGVFLDLSCSQSRFITNQSSRARLYTEHLHWLLYDEAGNMSLLEEIFDKANLSINADVTYVKLNSEEELSKERLFTLYDVYNKGSHLGGKLNITIDQNIYCNHSTCEIKEFLSELHKRTRLQQRSNLKGITFRQVALVTVLPLNSSEKSLMDFLNSEDNVHLDWITRLGYRNNLHLQEVLQFNFSNIWQDQWSLNDTIGGAIGEVVTEQVELSTSAFVLSPARLRAICPTMEVAQFRSVCLFRTPHNAGIKPGVFLEPFKPSVWLVFVALLVFSGLLLWLIFRLEHRWLQRCLAFIPSLLSSCLISIGAACIQGSHLIPNSTGGRLAFISLMLTSFLMYNYYTSIVVSTLLGSPVRSNIKTIQQLADSSLDVGFQDLPFNMVYLNSSPRTDIINLVKRKVEGRDPKSIWLNAKDGVLRVRQQPGFVFVLEASFSYNVVEKYYLPHEICELNEIPFRPESAVYTILHRNSTYKELFKQIQLRMLEVGMIQKHRLFYTKTKLHCFSNNYVIKVGMEYAAPLFIALLIAYFVALFVLLLELGWAYLGRRNLERLITSLPLDTPDDQIKAFLKSQDDIHKDPFPRMGYQTHQALMDMLDCNFSYIFRDRWSDRSELTGGLIEDLINGTVDLAATGFIYTSGRSKLFKPLAWHSSFRSVCMFLNPRSAGTELRVTEFLEPFSWSVWLMFSILLLFTGFLLWLTFLLERRMSRGDMETSLLTSCLLSFGAACIQGAWLLPRSTGGRMVFYAIMLTCFLMYNYYTSIVVSTLLGAPPKSIIRTIQQLADSNLEVAVEPTIYTKVYVESSDLADIRRLYRKKVLNKDPKRIWLSSEKGVLMVRNNPGFVFIAESATAYIYVAKHYLPHEICQLNEIMLRAETSGHTIVLKTSSFVELFKLSQLRLLETGVHFRNFRFWVRTKLHCYQSNVTVVVGLESAGPLFLLLLSAYIICLFVLGLEILWHKRQLRAARN